MTTATPERVTVKLTTEVWVILNGLKQPGETFDDVIRRLLDART
jgi:predicted CopG family antitoxin